MSVPAERAVSLLTIELRYEEDLVLARQRARQLAAALGFDTQEQTRLATAVSEIARNAFRYARGGRVSFAVAPVPARAGTAVRQHFVVRVDDQGPGVADLDAVLEGRYRSTTGMGIGIAGTRRLVDAFEIRSSPDEGTHVAFSRALPAQTKTLDMGAIAAIGDALARDVPPTPLAEVQAQNRELLHTLEALRERQAENAQLNTRLAESNESLARTNQELEETNRGVLALYAELDDRAEALRQASELKSRFLSNVSHELRTPLTSILNLSRVLSDSPTMELADEPKRALHFIRKSAQNLTDIVNDLLDLAKIEAGRVDLRVSEFSAAELLAALRGVCRPLATNDAVTLAIEEPPAITLVTDEGRLSQILRNLVSNALKYTERGEVVVTTSLESDATVLVTVRDTGIGVAPENQSRIFEEFTQVEGPLQRHVKGTGLGLPLSRRMAQLLGGTLTVESAVGVGSTFALRIPRMYPGSPDQPLGAAVAGALGTGAVDASRRPGLSADDVPPLPPLGARATGGPSLSGPSLGGSSLGGGAAADASPRAGG